MTDENEEDKPKQFSFEDKSSEFRETYSRNFGLYTSAEKAFRNLVHLLLSNSDIEISKVISRVKDRDECISKFIYKYKNTLEQENNLDYRVVDYITDLIGVRVVCLYEADIALVEAIMRDHFAVLDKTDKTKILYSDENSFGYKGLHLDLKLSGKRCDLDEYSKFTDLRFELQIRSIVQDAWSEIDHKLKYKKSLPRSLSVALCGWQPYLS